MASDIDDLATRLVAGGTEEIQPGPSLEQRNQRASVIVVQPVSNENRTDMREPEIITESHTDPDSRDSVVESVGNSPVFRRRRPRGKGFFISIFFN